MILAFEFRLLIYFDLFLCVVEERVQIHSLAYRYVGVPESLLAKLFFPFQLCWHTYQKSIDCRHMYLIMDSQSSPLIYMFILMSQHHTVLITMAL
jgi:hypothetical protein